MERSGNPEDTELSAQEGSIMPRVVNQIFMRRVRAFLIRVWHIARHEHEGDFDAEFEAHLQLRVDDNPRAGMSATEARRLALMKLGGLAQKWQRRWPSSIFACWRPARRAARVDPILARRCE